MHRQTSLPMFRSKTFSVRRRFSDFLGLYEKLSVKQSLHGCIIPPPPEKSVVGGCPRLLYCLKLIFFCTFMCCCFVFLTAMCANRNDQSEGGNGRPVISWVCGEKKSSSGEVRVQHVSHKWSSTGLWSHNYISTQACVFMHVSLPLTSSCCHLCLCRYLQRIVCHPSLLQDPDVREFLERDDVSIITIPSSAV